MTKKLRLLSSSFIMALTLAAPFAAYAMEPDEGHQPAYAQGHYVSPAYFGRSFDLDQPVVPTRTYGNDWLRAYFATALGCDTPIWEALTHSNNYKYNQFKDTYELTFFNPELLNPKFLPNNVVSSVKICNNLEFDLSNRTIFTQEIFDHLIMRVGSYFEDFTPKTPITELLLTPVTDSASHEITEIRMGMMLLRNAPLSKVPPTRTYINLYPISFDPRGSSMHLLAPTLSPSSCNQLYIKICTILASCFTLKKSGPTDLWKSPVSDRRRERLDGNQ